MPAVSFSSREFVDKIHGMDVFTTFRPHTRDPPRLKVEDIVTCFYKQRAKKECGNCINYHLMGAKEKKRGYCIDKNERKFRRRAFDICDEFNKIICKPEIIDVELTEIGWRCGAFYVKFIGEDGGCFREVGEGRGGIREDNEFSIREIARLDKFDSIGEFFEFFNSHYSLPLLFDRYTFRRIV